MPTTNPVPSTDPTDLLFNAGKLDEVVNGTANSFTDRLGATRRTVAGMNADFDAQLADAESDLNVYRADAAASAAEALGYLQTIRATSYGAYASDPATDPLGNPPTVGDEYFNTTANLLKRWNGTTWQASDISTANLAASSGSSLVGYDGGTVQDVLDTAKPMQSYTALRAYTGRATAVRITTPGIDGFFQRKGTSGLTDNGGTVIVDALGRAWERDYAGAVLAQWFEVYAAGVSDPTPKIQQALEACPEYGELLFSPGILETTAELVITKNRITVNLNGSVLKAKDGTNFEYIIIGTLRSGCIVKNGTLDANKQGRTATQTGRFMGGGFVQSEDCTFENITVRNTRGYMGIPAVGIGIAEAIRNRVLKCTFIDCGDAAPNASDGVYSAGESTLISDCVAFNCTDTAFVIENSNYSGIIGCIANQCSVGFGITAATNSDYRGNFAHSITINGWNSSVTGGVQIGCPSPGMTGNLYDTSVGGITMLASTPDRGNGPAFNVRRVSGSGKAIGVYVNGLVIKGSAPNGEGATTQGVYVDGDNVKIRNADIHVKETGVGFAPSTVGGLVSTSTITGGTFAVTGATGSKCKIKSCTLEGQSLWGIYAFDTAEITCSFNDIEDAVVGSIGKDAGATINHVGMYYGALSISNAVGAATTGSIINKFVVVDKNAGVIGYVPVYNV